LIIALKKSDATKANWKLELDDLWFAGNWNENGLYRFDGEYLHHLEMPKHGLEDEFYRVNKLATYSPNEVYKIYKDRKGNIWIGTSVFGACRYDGNEITCISEREMTEIDEGPASGVRSIVEERGGNIWFSNKINYKYKMLKKKSSLLGNNLKYEKIDGIDILSESEMSSFSLWLLQKVMIEIFGWPHMVLVFGDMMDKR
jgi:ligand-binding sensor domain-containing protein